MCLQGICMALPSYLCRLWRHHGCWHVFDVCRERGLWFLWQKEATFIQWEEKWHFPMPRKVNAWRKVHSNRPPRKPASADCCLGGNTVWSMVTSLLSHLDICALTFAYLLALPPTTQRLQDRRSVFARLQLFKCATLNNSKKFTADGLKGQSWIWGLTRP